MFKGGLRSLLLDDLRFHAGRGNKLYAWCFDHRLRLLRWARIKLAAARAGIPLVPAIMDVLILRWFSTQIGNNVTIGRRVKFAHPLGIVIGKGVVIGDECTIYQNVTLGGHSRRQTANSYPELLEGVTVFPNSVIVGGIKVGKRVTVGACSMVSRSVGDGETVGGVPAKPLNRPS